MCIKDDARMRCWKLALRGRVKSCFIATVVLFVMLQAALFFRYYSSLNRQHTEVQHVSQSNAPISALNPSHNSSLISSSDAELWFSTQCAAIQATDAIQRKAKTICDFILSPPPSINCLSTNHFFHYSPLLPADDSEGNLLDRVRSLMGDPLMHRCMSRGKAVVLSTAANEPRRAVEFVIYHLLLGASNVVLLDLSVMADEADGDYCAEHALSRLLRPLVDEGLVRVVTATDLLLTRVIPDNRDVTSVFFETEAAALEAADPSMLVVVTQDVSEYMLLGKVPVHHSPRMLCLGELIDELEGNNSAIRRHGLLLHRINAYPENLVVENDNQIDRPLLHHASQWPLLTSTALSALPRKVSLSMSDVAFCGVASVVRSAATRFPNLPRQSVFSDGSTATDLLGQQSFEARLSSTAICAILRIGRSLQQVLASTELRSRFVRTRLSKKIVFDYAMREWNSGAMESEADHSSPLVDNCRLAMYWSSFDAFCRMLRFLVVATKWFVAADCQVGELFLVAAREAPIKDGRQLVCPASSNNVESLFAGRFNNLFQDGFVHDNMLILTKKSRFVKELSFSPLLRAPIDAATQHVLTHLSAPHRCLPSKEAEVFVLSVCRDRPKRALEFVAHHLVLGASKVFVLDVGTGASDIPVLADHLAPFIMSGAVEVVFPPTPNSPHVTPRIRAVLDATEVDAAREAFFRQKSKDLYRSHPNGSVLLLDDVRDFVLLTDVEGLLEGAKHALRFPCLNDLMRTANVERLLLPVVKNDWSLMCFDNARSGLEFIHFATGNSDVMLHGIAVAAERGNLHRKVRFLGKVGATASVESLQQLALEASFVDGTRGSTMNLRFQDATKVMFTARVVSVGDSNQRYLEDIVDQCYRNIAEGAVPPTTESFDVIKAMELRYQHDVHFMIDLPQRFSLRRIDGSFATMYRSFLALLNFSASTVHIFASAKPISTVIKGILQPWLEYSSGRHRMVKDSDVTNENFVSGVVRFIAEVPPTLSYDLIAGRLGGARMASRSSCPTASLGTLLFPTTDEGKDTTRSNVSLCLITKDRLRLTMQHILYHRTLGVGHFVVGDDHSVNDSLRTTLRPLIELGIVEVVSIGDLFLDRDGNGLSLGFQVPFYHRCAKMEVERARREGHASFPWVGFLDNDEFVILKKDMGCLPAALDRAVLLYHQATQKNAAAVGLQWRIIGTSREVVVERAATPFEISEYLLESQPNDGHHHCKIFIRPELMDLVFMFHPHGFSFRSPGTADLHGCTYLGGTPMNCGGFGDVVESHSDGYLAHFARRSLVSFLSKHLGGRADFLSLASVFDVDALTEIDRQVTREARGSVDRIEMKKEFLSLVHAEERETFLRELMSS